MSTGAHAARRQPCFGGQFCLFHLFRCEWRVALRVPHARLPPAFISTARQRVYLLVFVVVELSVCEHRGACCTSTTMFLGGQLWFLCHFYEGEWLVAPCVAHSHLLPPSCRQRSSVCICLYLSRSSRACVGTGAHGARRQPWLFVGSCVFYLFY